MARGSETTARTKSISATTPAVDWIRQTCLAMRAGRLPQIIPAMRNMKRGNPLQVGVLYPRAAALQAQPVAHLIKQARCCTTLLDGAYTKGTNRRQSRAA